MKVKSMFMLAVALGCGLVAMMGVQQVLSGDKKGDAKALRKQVLIAKTEILPGAPLDDTNVAFKEMPQEAVPEGAVTEKEQYEQRALQSRAVPGELIMAAKLGDKGVFGPSTEIPEGMRVVTVSVNLTKTHSGLIRPSDRVDVLVTYKSRVESQQPISKTKTVLEYIKVFATDSLRTANGNETTEIHAKNISLLVTPEQANLLMLAQSKGELHLSLRHKNDDATVHVPDVDDMRFDRTLSSTGTEDEVEGEAVAGAETAVHEGGVKEFLKKQQAPPAPAVPDETVEAAPAVPKWKMTIYSGKNVKVEEVDMPTQPVSAGSPWQGVLQKFLMGT
jgi:pilus assembly protein CpaB